VQSAKKTGQESRDLRKILERGLWARKPREGVQTWATAAREPSWGRTRAKMPTDSNLKNLFFEAIDLPPQEQRDFLAELEGRDSEMSRQLEQLVKAHERAELASEAAQRSLEEESAAGLKLPIGMGNYELLEYIAEGGSGVVYRARQIDLNRTVAIKLLRSGLLATGEEVQRFRVEAEVSALLDHPSIVPVYEVGKHEGRHFISMKLIEGPSLGQCTEKYHDDPRAAAELIARIAHAVDHGHRHGVLHRDVKPSNILLDKDGAPYVTDFGTAKLIDGARRQTVTGLILGTPSYMAPEQASATGDVTVATDVYSLGCVLYELLVGRPPVVAAGLIETLRQVKEETPTAVRAVRSEIHRDLETICHKCLAKEPERRYKSALALAQDLERWIAYEPIQARRATHLERMLLAWRRSPLVTSLIAAVALLAVSLVVGAVVATFELQASIEETREAKEFAREQLRNAYLAEARALRHGGRAGRREQALELLGLAAAIRPGRDLLDEGASSLALSDIASERSWPQSAKDRYILCFDGSFERYFLGLLNGELEVRSATDGSLLFNLEGNGYPVWRARFSANGRYLGLVHHARSGAQGQRTVIWDLEGPVRLLDVPSIPVGHFDFAPDRPAVALCWPDGRMHEIDLDTLEERSLVQFDPLNPPRMIRYSSTGNSIAVAFEETHPVGVYSLEGELLTELKDHDEQVLTISWSPDGTRLLAGCGDHRAYVWEIESGERLATLVGHRAEIVRSAFPRRDVAATSSWDGTTRLWDLKTSETLAITDEILHESPLALDRLGLSTPKRVRVGMVVHGSILRELRGHEHKDPSSISVDATDTLIASGGEMEVLLWDLASGTRLDQLNVESFLDQLFLPDGSLLVASRESLVRWRIERGRFAGDPELVYPGPSKYLAATPDGQLLAFLSLEHLNLMPLDGEGESLQIHVQPGTTRLALSADAGLVAAGCYRGSGVRIWSTTDGKEVAHLAPEESDCTPQFSPDGRWIAFGTDHEYHVHRVGTWERVYRASRNYSTRASAKVTRYSPDSKLLAGTSGRSHLMLLEATTGEALVVFEPPGRQLFSMARFTSDGRHLLVSSESNRVLIWDLERLREELAIAGLDTEIGPGWTNAAPTEQEQDK
jgi:WD40 repeat protein/predicted Ser/Thr protein kinase